MERKISFDMDGVVSDIGAPFYLRFEREYGLKPTRDAFVHLMHSNEPWENISPTDFQRFNTEYLKELHRSGYQSLEPIEGSIDGLLALKNKEHNITVNSTRPREFEGQVIDTLHSTREWLNRWGLDFVDLNVAQSSDEKVENIARGNYVTHVDDQEKILYKIKKSRPIIRLGLHAQIFGDHGFSDTSCDYTLLNNWAEIVQFCAEQDGYG